MEKEISTKNTKQEIIDAYNELLDVIQQKENPQQKREKEEKENVVSKAAQNSKDTIIKQINDLKSRLNQFLEETGESLINEVKRLSEIRDAIIIEKKNLEDLYKITANADSLAAMLLAHEEKRKDFAEEMANYKTEWEKNKENLDIELKEYKTRIEKERKREEEDFQYTLKLKRKKEQDGYDEQRQQSEKEVAESKERFEKEMSEREQVMKSKETELDELRQKATQFPIELEKSIKTTEKSITEQLTRQFEVEKKLTVKETETEIKLKDQIIQTLEAKIKEIEAYNKQLTTKTETAEKTVKDIAIKAIESASKNPIIETFQSNRESKT